MSIKRIVDYTDLGKPKYKKYDFPEFMKYTREIKYTKRNSIWKDYVVFTFNGLDIGHTPSISYCISVHKDYYKSKGDLLLILAYLNFGDTIEKCIKDYCDLCKKIDKDYDLNEIIKSV